MLPLYVASEISLINIIHTNEKHTLFYIYPKITHNELLYSQYPSIL
jgi:hypothetical protein